jgi:hypothetical protein
LRGDRLEAAALRVPQVALSGLARGEEARLLVLVGKGHGRVRPDFGREQRQRHDSVAHRVEIQRERLERPPANRREPRFFVQLASRRGESRLPALALPGHRLPDAREIAARGSLEGQELDAAPATPKHVNLDMV